MDIAMRLGLSHRLSHRLSPCLRRRMREHQVCPWQMLSGQATEPEIVPAPENAPAP